LGPGARVHVSPERRTAQLVLVANAHASGVGPELVAGVQAELRRWGACVETLVTESSAEWIERLGDDIERRVVFVGGDGTLHAAVNATAIRPEVALVPGGRANNIARSLGIPLAPRAAARLAVEGRVRPVDLLEAATPTRRRVTVEAVSVGFLAEAHAYYHGENSAHVAAALQAGAHALTEFTPLRVRITTPLAVDELTLTQLFVANLPLYGFRLHVAPDADPTDELLDVVAIEGYGRMAIPRMIGNLLLPRPLGGSEIHRWRADRVRVETPDSPAFADSFDLGSGPLDVSVLPKNLRLVRR
jgi:diacylglycerol kinase (ATP)